jgi:pimeloyl-ACP methyl ester carboxylesterase
VKLLLHSIALVLTTASAASSGQAQPAVVEATTFNVFVAGRQVGSEESTLEHTPTGWRIGTTGRLGPPFNVITRRMEIRYDEAWKPLELTIEAAIDGRAQRLHTTFQGTSATSEYSLLGELKTTSAQVAADTIVLPSPFFGAYEAIAARLSASPSPTELKAYVVPQAEVTIQVKGVSNQRFLIGTRSLDARRYLLAFVGTGQPTDVELWTDASGRLLRMQVPAQNIDVLRHDVSLVSARIERISHPGDEQVAIEGNGFTLASTISRPTASPSTPRLPAIVLLGDSSALDRDGVIDGVPVLGELAGQLADRGFLVVRYDKRGTGQSGGRPESVSIPDYSEDVRAVVRYLREREDVDDRRIALVGHGEGGWVALMAAAGFGDAKAVVTIGSGGTPGSDLIMEQQRLTLERSNMSAGEKETALDVQQKILQAVMENGTWEGIPPDMRRRADTLLYRSFLAYDPAVPFKRLDQPLLVLHGEVDTFVPPDHAGRLVALATARKRKAPVDTERLPGLDHSLIDRTSRSLSVSGTVADVIGAWLQKVLPPPPARR